MKKINNEKDRDEETELRSSLLSVDGQEWDVSNLLQDLGVEDDDEKLSPALKNIKDSRLESKYYSADAKECQDDRTEYRKVPESLKKTPFHNDNLTLKRVPKYKWRSPSPSQISIQKQESSAMSNQQLEPQPLITQEPQCFDYAAHLFQENNFEYSLIEVSPGEEMPLRGSRETQFAIEQNYVITSNCMGCTLSLSCVRNSKYVLCPLCHCISPLELSSLRTEGNSFGVGLGFVEDEL